VKDTKKMRRNKQRIWAVIFDANLLEALNEVSLQKGMNKVAS